MERLIERCAGLDVHRDTVVACVRLPGESGRSQETRTFRTTTVELLALRDWLEASQVTVVGMEATGIYWRPVWHVLEDAFECQLINAQHIKTVPGRKTDVSDAGWICQLVEHGLVRPSFVPPQQIRDLRDLTRFRKDLIQERTRYVQRMEKFLQDAGVKLSSVASKVLGASGRAMIEALCQGTADPEVLAELAKGRLRAKLPALREALEGRFRPHHALLCSEILAHIDHLEEAIQRISAEIDRVIAPFAKQVDLLDTIPGVDRKTAEILIAEMGPDMSRFPSHQHLASWAGLCPGNNESGGKRRSGRMRKGSKALRTALAESAKAASRTKDTYLRSQYLRIKARAGHGKATMAVAHSILVAAYYMLLREVPYQDLGGDYFEKRNQDEHAKRLARQIERLGYQVTLQPLAQPACVARHVV